MSTIPLDEIVPFGTKVVCRDEAGETEWAFGDAIRQGGTGRVYEVFECRVPFRHGAIKLLRPDRDDAATSFDREGERLMGRVAGEHGPKFFGRGTFRGRPFVIMEFARPIRRGLGIREALTFVDELADGLSVLHANGLCHGDIKPHNLGLFDGRPGLLDFGSVRPIIPDATRGEVTRTPGYSAPELEDSGCAAPWVDVYGLAATLNEILSPKALDAFAPVLRAGMDLRAETRIQTPEEFASAMHGCHRAHRRFGVVAKWATVAVVSVVVGLGAIMSARAWQRRNELRTRHAAMIEKRARALAGALPRAAELGGEHTRGNAGKHRGEQQGLAPLPQNSRE